MSNHPAGEISRMLHLLMDSKPILSDELKGLLSQLHQQLQQSPDGTMPVQVLHSLSQMWQQVQSKAPDLFQVVNAISHLNSYFVAIDRHLLACREGGAVPEGPPGTAGRLPPASSGRRKGRGRSASCLAPAAGPGARQLVLLPFTSSVPEKPAQAGNALRHPGEYPSSSGLRLVSQPADGASPLTTCPKQNGNEGAPPAVSPRGPEDGEWRLLPEQQSVVDDPLRENLLVSAVAGAGKTTTLVHIARARPRQSILYLCFDNAMARKAETMFPRNTQVSTLHALAYRECGWRYRQKLQEGRTLSLSTLREWMAGFPEFNGFAPEVQSSLTGILHESIRRFLQVPERSLTLLPPGNGNPSFLHRMWAMLTEKQEKYLRDCFYRWWEQAQDAASAAPISHDVYFKLWVSTCPRLMADLIVLDEAQDTNPLAIALLEWQKTPRVIIGDPHQSIYAWRGARNALDAFGHYRQKKLSTSFRFGPAVAELASGLLWVKKCEVRIHGGGPATVLLPPGEVRVGQTVICRSQAGVLEVAAQCIARRLPFDLPAALADYVLREIVPLYQFWYNGESDHERYRLFHSWDEYVDYCHDVGERDSLMRIRLIETRQQELRQVFAALREKSGDMPPGSGVWITTAHRAKGQEFDEVHLWDDFADPAGSPPPEDEEVNLLYMAVTRARHRLMLNAATWNWWQRTG